MKDGDRQPVYSPGFPGYTIRRVGFRLSPTNPILLKPPWISPILARSRKGGALFLDLGLRISDFELGIGDRQNRLNRLNLQGALEESFDKRL
jgi:hypothetical protein